MMTLQGEGRREDRGEGRKGEGEEGEEQGQLDGLEESRRRATSTH